MATSTTPTTEKRSTSNERTNGASEGSDLEIRLDVEPRKPRLAWQGMERREAAVSVPTQVVEIVRPGKAQAAEDLLPGVMAGQQKARRDELPPNRLIWTSDNLVALQTLLDEKDPATRDYLFRGKVDLVYIDPPFMVQSDFRAENAVEIELDEDEHVEAKKEPSLVEILAYRDTWRQGLDSFLSMLRARLGLPKDLLAPTGSIYVHLDWHAVHYVKVLMDELFGYENFVNEIVWKRTSARSDAKGFNHIHDTLLVYSASAGNYWSPVYGPYSTEYIRSHYGQVDQKTGRRFTLDNLTSPNPRPNMTYEWKGYAPPANGWRFSRETMRNMDEEGLIHYPPKGGRLRFKRFLDDQGMPLLSMWNDIPPVNSQAAERLAYPTQKPVELIERVLQASCPAGGLILDCFVGSGTTAEAAERSGRRWIGIDNAKYAIHLTRKRLIQLHGQPKGAKTKADYAECTACGNIERKDKPARSKEAFVVAAFAVENIGVYQRAEAWQDFQTQRTKYRDEMIKVFGGEPVNHSPLLHGRKGNSWVHVGPLDGPVSATQVWSIAREAQRSDRKSVTVLSADFDTLSLASQRPVLKPLSDAKTPTAKKKLKAEHEKCEARQVELEKWLGKANTWQKFIGFWAVDWDYGPRVGVDGKPIFETDWQSFRVRKAKGEVDPLVLTAEYSTNSPDTTESPHELRTCSATTALPPS